MKKSRKFLIQKSRAFLFVLFLLVITFLTFLVKPADFTRVKTMASSPFVFVQGTQLYLNDKPFRFIGYNQYSLNSGSITACGSVFSDIQLNTLLDVIKNTSRGGVVRTWFFQSFANPINGWSYFDRLIAAAKQRGILLIPTLVNQWGDCEPGMVYKNLNWYQGGYKQANDGYQMSYLSYIQAVALRYSKEPTIAFWQLINEAEAANSRSGTCSEEAAASAIKLFADTAAGSIRSVDQNHLINLGTIGTGQCGTSGSDYQTVQSGADLNLLEYHDYGSDTTAMPGDKYNGLALRLVQAKNLNKPIFIGESGIKANVQSNGIESGEVSAATLMNRANDFQGKMTAQFQNNIAGFLIWSKGFTNSVSYDIGANDPTEPVMAKISLLNSLYYPISPPIILQKNTVSPINPSQISPSNLTNTFPSLVPPLIVTPVNTLSKKPAAGISGEILNTPVNASKIIPKISNTIILSPPKTAITSSDSTLSILFVTSYQAPLTNAVVSSKNSEGVILTTVTNQDGVAAIPQNSVIESVQFSGSTVFENVFVSSQINNKIVVNFNKLAEATQSVERKSFPISTIILVPFTIILFIGVCLLLLYKNRQESKI